MPGAIPPTSKNELFSKASGCFSEIGGCFSILLRWVAVLVNLAAEVSKQY